MSLILCTSLASCWCVWW